MKQYIINTGLFIFLSASLACNSSKQEDKTSDNLANTTGGQASVQDDVSQKDVLKIAAGSKDHTTLVAAIKQAELVNALSNAGPFTVFAPTNAAFDKLPAGTVDGLMKPEKKTTLQDILQYHVSTSGLPVDLLKNMQSLGMVNGGRITITEKDGKIMLNNTATIIASVKASNGMVHIIDAVLLPPTK
jgi:uncharacterized surface protein with fasciclin (FAS1) repeats